MAVSFTTGDPAALLAAFRAAITGGEIKNWMAAAPASGDFSLTDREFGRVWFRAKTQAGELIFNLVRGLQCGQVPTVLYSYYHGQLMETFLRHLGPSFGTVTATAVATAGDLV